MVLLTEAIKLPQHRIRANGVNAEAVVCQLLLGVKTRSLILVEGRVQDIVIRPFSQSKWAQQSNVDICLSLRSS